MLPHNEKTLQEVITYTDQNKNCCVVNPCGSGKTSIMAAFIALHPSSTFVIITKQKNAATYYKNKDKLFATKNVIIVTYNAMYNDYKAQNIEKYNTDYLLIDEAHYIAAQKWKSAFSKIQKTYHPITIGFTATPQRFEDQGTKNTIINDFFDNNSAGNFSIKQLQKAGVFVEPKYILSLYNMDTIIEKQIAKINQSDLSEIAKKFWCKKLETTLQDWKDNTYPEKILKENLPNYMYKKHCNRILVYTPNAADIPQHQTFIDTIIKNIFPQKSVQSYVYTYKTSEQPFNDFLEEDSNDIKILYSIDKIMETIHIDDLRIMIMLRPSISNRIITQQFGRINSITNKNQPLIIDMVNNLENLSTLSPNQALSGQERHYEETQETLPTITLPSYITKYRSIFSRLDNTLKSVKYYTYDEFTGTLHDICYVFNADYQKAKKYIQTHDIIETIKASQKPCHVTQEIFDDVPSFCDTPLTKAQTQYATENISIIDQFIQRRNIIDDDIKQNLYMRYLQDIIKTDTAENQKAFRNQRIAADINKYYLKLIKNKYIKNTCFISDTVKSSNVFYDIDMEQYIQSTNISQIISNTFSKLTEREKYVIQCYFGFHDGEQQTLDKIAKDLNKSKERIRQILARALRKLRHPNSAKQLRPCLEYYNNQTEHVLLTNTNNNNTLNCNQSALNIFNL